MAPRELFIGALNRNLNLQRFRVLYVSGNYSGILSGLDRRFTELEIRRGFTVFQLRPLALCFVERCPMASAQLSSSLAGYSKMG